MFDPALRGEIATNYDALLRPRALVLPGPRAAAPEKPAGPLPPQVMGALVGALASNPPLPAARAGEPMSDRIGRTLAGVAAQPESQWAVPMLAYGAPPDAGQKMLGAVKRVGNAVADVVLGDLAAAEEPDRPMPPALSAEPSIWNRLGRAFAAAGTPASIVQEPLVEAGGAPPASQAAAVLSLTPALGGVVPRQLIKVPPHVIARAAGKAPAEAAAALQAAKPEIDAGPSLLAHLFKQRGFAEG